MGDSLSDVGEALMVVGLIFGIGCELGLVCWGASPVEIFGIIQGVFATDDWQFRWGSTSDAAH